MKYSKLFLTIIVVALIFSCTKKRTTTGEFIIVATGNVQGSINPYKIRLDSLGGLARRSTFLKDFRSTGENPILLDAGNLFNGQINSIGLIKCYNEIGYDALNVGAQDLTNAINIGNLENVADFPFISANIINRESGKPVFKQFTTIERNGIILAIIGLTNNLLDNTSVEYGIIDPIQAGKNLLEILVTQSDYQVILFNGSIDDAVVTRDALIDADFMFVSGHTGVPRKTQPPENGPFLYKLGEYGRALVTIKTHIANIDSSLKDISMLIEREKFIKETLHLMRGGSSMSLEKMYAGNYNMSQRIKKIKKELELARTELASATNTVEFNLIPLSSSIIDDVDIKRIINEASMAVKK